MAKRSFTEILNSIEPPDYYELLGIPPDTARDPAVSEPIIQQAIQSRHAELLSLATPDQVKQNLWTMISNDAAVTFQRPSFRWNYDKALTSATVHNPVSYSDNYILLHIFNREAMLGRKLTDEECPTRELKRIAESLACERASRYSPRALSIDSILKTRCMTSFANTALAMGITPGEWAAMPVYHIPMTQAGDEERFRLQDLALHIGIKSFATSSSASKDSQLTLLSRSEAQGVILSGAGIFSARPDSSILFRLRPEFAAANLEALEQFLNTAGLATAPDKDGNIVYRGEQAMHLMELLEMARTLSPLSQSTRRPQSGPRSL